MILSFKLLAIVFVLEDSCAQVALSPSGETTLACVSASVQFNCTAPVSAVYTTAGFRDDDTNFNTFSGRLASERSPRINTSDTAPTVSFSSIIIRKFSYGDQNATIACLNGMDVTEATQTRIDVGPPVCDDVVLTFLNTLSTITTMWTVSSCEGSSPMTFEIQWNSTVADRSGSSGHLSSVTQYVITGLSSGTVYTISLILSDACGTGSILLRNVSTLSRGTDPNTSSDFSNSTSPPLSPGAIAGIVIAVVIIIVGAIFIIVLIIFFYWKNKESKSPIAERMTVPSYANPEEMRDKKEQKKTKTEELTYVTVDVSNAPPADSKKPKKAEAVEYTGVQFAQP